MLDRGMRIRRLTPTADKLLKIRPSDVGRPLADIRPNIDVLELEESVAKVLETLQPEEREVRDRQGRWHSLNILPYRTQNDKIDGIVLAASSGKISTESSRAGILGPSGSMKSPAFWTVSVMGNTSNITNPFASRPGRM